MVWSRASQSLRPGQRTTWVWTWIPRLPSRRSCVRMSGALAVARRRRGQGRAGGKGEVGGGPGDMEGAQPVLGQALPVCRDEVRERDEVAEEEGEAVVVVLDVQAGARLLWDAIDEAEEAAVVADTQLRKERLGELKPQRCLRGLLDAAAIRPPSALDLEHETRLGAGKTIVDDIAKRTAIDGHEAVAGPEAKSSGRAIWLYGGDDAPACGRRGRRGP